MTFNNRAAVSEWDLGVKGNDYLPSPIKSPSTLSAFDEWSRPPASEHKAYN